MKVTRREVVKSSIAVSLPFDVPCRVIGKTSPSNRIHVAMIGMGRQASYANLLPFLQSSTARVVAVCDVDRWRLANAKKKVDEHYKTKDCRAEVDWREVIARDDIDAVMNSTPDQWHVPISITAVRAGKHVCCEKPLTLSIAEGRVLADAVKKAGVVFRTDSECRTHGYMHKTAQLVRNGYLGKVRRIAVGVPTGDTPGGNPAPMAVPPELSYDMWLGPAPQKPYTLDRVHPRESYGRPGWMRCSDTCQGMITNWGTHLLDVAQQVNDTERTGPISVEATGRFPAPGSGLWDVLIEFKAQFRYADGVVLDYIMDVPYLRVEGEEGWIEAHWHSDGGLTAHDKQILRMKLKDTDLHLPQRMDKEDYLYCIERNAPEESMIDAEVGHRTCSMGQLALIAIMRGKTLAWDPDIERFNDAEANRLLTKGYRDPWDLDVQVKQK